jgi:hypothetical protein
MMTTYRLMIYTMSMSEAGADPTASEEIGWLNFTG